MRIYLDDERTPKVEPFDRVCRTPREFMQALWDCEATGEKITYISFDHDLGVDSHTNNLYDNGYDLARALCLKDGGNEGCLLCDTFTFNVHSANPVGAENIRAYMNNYLKSKEEKHS
jgi:hypothetical protein